jgi:2-amino-4-hydroxy-6-hydroxymethyldihydropteridine diphosphokinase/dihydropteroate synthase
MTIYLGLGSNDGNRNANLQEAIKQLRAREFEVSEISPVVETPALLPEGAEPAWNRPFLNCVVAGQANWEPEQGLKVAKEIETGLGRRKSRKWAPRVIDIDLLLWHDQVVETENLTIPHYGIPDRSFVLTPLLHLKPDLVLPGLNRTVSELCRPVKPVPIWMGILNITPDSFSDGGAWTDEEALLDRIDSMIAENVQIIDVGAESTRPNAAAIGPAEEWRRLRPVLQLIDQRLDGRTMRPMVSVDSRHALTLEKALAAGVQMINDVSGLRDPAIRELAIESGCQVVAMHSMSIPVDPGVLLPTDDSAVNQLQAWLGSNLNQWVDSGLDPNRIIFDPGIGFGKNPLQSLQLLQNCAALKENGIRLLVGHSRKSFMSSFTDRSFADRDLETLGMSLALCQQGVEIIRVHDPVMHVRAYRGWSHVNAG